MSNETTFKLKRGVSGGAFPASLTHGELAINTTDRRLFVGSSTGNALPLNNRIFIGATQDPEGSWYPLVGDRWWTGIAGGVEKIWDGSTWQTISSSSSMGLSGVTITGATLTGGVNAFGGATFTGNFVLNGNLTVNGTYPSAGGYNPNALLLANAGISAQGGATFRGIVRLLDDVIINENAARTLTVRGPATFLEPVVINSGGISVTGGLAVTGGAVIHGNVRINGNLSLSGNPAISWSRTDPTVATNLTGVPSGTTFAAGTSAITILEQILYPYQPVSFASFAIGISGGVTTFDIGATSPAGRYNATWSFNGPTANWVNGSIYIINQTFPSTTLTGGAALNATGSPAGLTHPAYRFASPQTMTFQITGQQISGTNPVSRTTSVNWLHRIYYGKSASATPSSVSNITTGQTYRYSSSTTSPGAFSYSFIASASPEYSYVFVPSALAQYTSWTVSNNPFTPVQGTFTENNSQGVSIQWTWYQVSNPTTGTYTVAAS